MKTIGITGGIGAGKTKILAYIEEHCSCEIIRADETAHMLEQPGNECYEALVRVLGQETLTEDGLIDKKRMAEKIFSDAELLSQINGIVHPAVKKYICRRIEEERVKGEVTYFFVEAALLIEEHYDEILDELWYIHADASIREKRLMETRQYSKEKAESIMKGQLSEEEFRRHCQVVIVNNDDLAKTYRQLDELL